MRYILSKIASQELEEGYAYYELQKEGLGNEFKEMMQRAIDEVFTSPYLYPLIVEPIHRKVTNRFPYNIFYRIDNEAIVILSISHQHRKPFYTV